jgi:hypothetical protein
LDPAQIQPIRSDLARIQYYVSFWLSSWRPLYPPTSTPSPPFRLLLPPHVSTPPPSSRPSVHRSRRLLSCNNHVGAPVGTVAGTVSSHPLADHLFLTAGTSAPVGPAVGTVRPLDAAVTIGAPPVLSRVLLALGHCSRRWCPSMHYCWRPQLAVLRSVYGRSLVLVNTTHLLHGTPLWLSGAARHLVLLLRPIHGRSPILVIVARLLRSTLVLPSRATSGTLVHSASAIIVTALDVVVWGVGPTISHRLSQLNDVCFPHAYDQLGGRLRHHQPYHTPPWSHLFTHALFACAPFFHRCW